MYQSLKDPLFILRLVFHCLFIIPLFYEKYFYSLALICLVLVFYAKVSKYQTLIEDSSTSEKDRACFTKVKRRWMILTFLKE